MKKLLIATTNPAKFWEIKYFLKDLPLEFLSLKEVGIKEKAGEEKETCEENAKDKALFYSLKSNLPTVSDDSSLEIDYLNGAPGVYSRRWIGGKETSDEELIKHALNQMKNVPFWQRTAKMKMVAAFALPDGEVHTGEGEIRGLIAEKPYMKYYRSGFPFRAIFYLPEIKKYYVFEEMTEEENKKYNHRYQALEKLKKAIKKELPG